MSLMMSKTYTALCAAGVPDDLAREAAEELAGYENRFVRIDNRFDTLDSRLDVLETRIDARFEAVDARFAALENHIDSRLAAVENRITIRLGGVIVVASGVILAVMKLLG